ncbi:3-deoxy-7-phosphoheptulonate synthase, partial [[Clostridium] spiroforme]|nr:3-deoxy-7-phosphoheptulonate synthase [Thomasclavelia spiroformis]
MIIVLKPDATKEDQQRIVDKACHYGLIAHISQGEETTVIGLVGDTTKIDGKRLEVDPAVEKVMSVSEPYKLANRAFHPEDSIIEVGDVKIGGD